MKSQRHFAYLVEEEGAAVGQLEAADLAGIGPGEGPPLVAEKLTFDEAFGQRGAVHFGHHPLVALAVAV